MTDNYTVRGVHIGKTMAEAAAWAKAHPAEWKVSSIMRTLDGDNDCDAFDSDPDVRDFIEAEADE